MQDCRVNYPTIDSISRHLIRSPFSALRRPLGSQRLTRRDRADSLDVSMAPDYISEQMLSVHTRGSFCLSKFSSRIPSGRDP
eukprot:1188995-Prorocentrum_minimum.AAC.3